MAYQVRTLSVQEYTIDKVTIVSRGLAEYIKRRRVLWVQATNARFLAM